MKSLRINISPLFERPRPADIQSVMASTQLSMCVMICLAIVCTPIAAFAMSFQFAAFWLAGTLLLAGTVLVKSRGKADVQIKYVSDRLIRRLLLFQVILALPFSILAFVLIGFGTGDIGHHIAWPCAGMSAGGAALLRRTLLASFVYCGTLTIGALVGVLLNGGPATLTISAGIILFSVFLFYLSIFLGETERERDQSLAELSEAVTDLERARDENYRLANVDTITGLANRKAFTEFSEIAVKQFVSEGVPFTLLLLDLDRFKNVNDMFGHAIGDQLIGVIGTRLRNFVGGRGEVGRLGGDEFAVLLPGVQDARQISDITDNLLARVNEPAQLAGRALHPGTSIGVAICPKHGQTSASLMLAADVALNRVKEAGRGSALIFDEELHDELVREDQIEAGLRAAISGSGLAIHYQPKVCLTTGQPRGAEALVRWSHPRFGQVSPTEFLHVASERGLMPKLSRCIAELVCLDILSWREAGLPYGHIALNIHPVDLKSPDLLLQQIGFMEDQGVTSEDIVIEVTEGCFVGRGNDAALLLLDNLAERGYTLSLDDFGTGHASLSHLRGLPVKELKIDRTFISGVVENRADRAIVSAMIEIARGMKIRAVAEGVETQEQQAVLAQMGIKVGQGYLWAQPLPEPDFTAYLSRGSIAKSA